MSNQPNQLEVVAAALEGLARARELGKNDLRLAMKILVLTVCREQASAVVDCKEISARIGMREDHCRTAFARLLTLGPFRRQDDVSVSPVIDLGVLSSGEALTPPQSVTAQEVLPLQGNLALPGPALGSGSAGAFDVHAHCERFRTALASDPEAVTEQFPELPEARSVEWSPGGLPNSGNREPLIAKGSQIPESGGEKPPPTGSPNSGKWEPLSINTSQIPENGRATTDPTGSPNSGIRKSLNDNGSQIPEFGNGGIKGGKLIAKEAFVQKSSLAKSLGAAPAEAPSRDESERCWQAIAPHLAQCTGRQIEEWRLTVEKYPIFVRRTFARAEVQAHTNVAGLAAYIAREKGKYVFLKA